MHPALTRLHESVRRVIVGKEEVIRHVLTAILARGHILIEDVPGLGKTMLARSLALSLQAEFRRIQFTPDLLPTDVTGVSVFHPERAHFEFVHGPVFADVLLADEINRTSPRTQSALLEAMEERQVTVDGVTHPLPPCFFVIATQNPIEHEGTFPLPEAQIDRFLMRLELGYPTHEQETSILAAQVRSHPIDDVRPVLALEELRDLQRLTVEVRVGPEIRDYIVHLAAATRELSEVRVGVSPRGSLALMRAAQARAFLDGAEYVSPDTVKSVAFPVLAHRLIVDSYREGTGTSRQELIQRVLEKVEVPTLPAQSTKPRDAAAAG